MRLREDQTKIITKSFFVDRVLSCHQCLRGVYSWPGLIFSERMGAAILALTISPLTLHNAENNDHLSH